MAHASTEQLTAPEVAVARRERERERRAKAMWKAIALADSHRAATPQAEFPVLPSSSDNFHLNQLGKWPETAREGILVSVVQEPACPPAFFSGISLDYFHAFPSSQH